MTTSRSLSHTYPVSASALASLLSDSDYLKSRSESAGDENVSVEVQKGRDGVRIVTARDRKSIIPEFARRLIGNRSRIVDETTWREHGAGYRAEYAIRIEGAPVSVEGSTLLLPSAEGCLYETSFEVTARVPLLGKKVENAVADQIEQTLREHGVRNAARLSTLPPPPPGVTPTEANGANGTTSVAE